MKNIKWWNRK